MKKLTEKINEFIKRAFDAGLITEKELEYTGDPEEAQWCPECKKYVIPNVVTLSNNGEDVTGWTVTCDECQHLFDED